MPPFVTSGYHPPVFCVANALLNAIMEFNKAKCPLKHIAESVLAGLAGSKLVCRLDPLTGLPEVKLEHGDRTSIRKTPSGPGLPRPEMHLASIM